MPQTIYGLQIGPNTWLTSDGREVTRWRPTTGEVVFGAVGEAEAGAARRAHLWGELVRRDRARFEKQWPGFEYRGDSPPQLDHASGLRSEWRRTVGTAGLWWLEVTVRGSGMGWSVPADPAQVLRQLDLSSADGCNGGWMAA